MFISHTKSNQAVADILQQVLIEKDYSVWTPEYNLKTDDSWNIQISNAITRCAKEGFYVLLISEESISSGYVEKELEYATGQGAWIIPIIIGDPVMPDWMKQWLGKCVVVSEKPTKHEFNDVIKLIDTIMLKKIRNLSEE